ncbi:hypothetical protein [Actinoplanes sp. NPDC023714]|uniref:hypothetical protein n=1 Tax=Actinoplanes sp. NPDC023714 TaxID=3154322 RepID=UPI0033FE8AE4
MTKKRASAAMGLALIGAALTACGSEPADAVTGSPAAAAATEEALRALEADATFGRETTQEPGWRPVCAGRPMGLSPEGADPRTVYAWIYCKWVPGERTSITDLPALAAPVAIHLTSPLRYELPADGEDHSKSLAEIFPANLREAAAGGSPEESAAMAELDAAVARAMG